MRGSAILLTGFPKARARILIRKDEKLDVKRLYKSLLLSMVNLFLLQCFLGMKILLLAQLRDSSCQEKERINRQASRMVTYPEPRPVGSYTKDFFHEQAIVQRGCDSIGDPSEFLS